MKKILSIVLSAAILFVPSKAEARSYCIKHGDNLTKIAQNYYPDASPQKRKTLINLIADINNLNPDSVVAGQYIHIPNFDYQKYDIVQLIQECLEANPLNFNLSKAEDLALIKAIIKNESAFDQYAISYSGAKGFMQLIDKTAYELYITNPFEPKQNIIGGLRDLKRKYGLFDNTQDTVWFAVAAYNAGPRNVYIAQEQALKNNLNPQRFSDIKHYLPKQTQKFVTKVAYDFEMFLKH